MTSYYPTSASVTEDTVILENNSTIDAGKGGVFLFSESWGDRSGGYSMVIFRTKVTGESSDLRVTGFFISRAVSKAYFFEIEGTTVHKFNT